MHIVILAEKPNQAKDISQIFKNVKRNNGYYEITDNDFFPNASVTLTYGIGHLVGLALPTAYDEKYKQWRKQDLPIFPQNFKFEVTKGTKDQFQTVKKLLKQADTLIIATDSDREGENIAYSIFNQAGVNFSKVTIKRAWFNSQTKEELTRAFKNLRPASETYNFYLEAQAREKADWLTGMNLSRLATLLFGEHHIQETFSMGRVQTPTLYMIFKRNFDIEHFKPQDYYQLKSNVHSDKGDVLATYEKNFTERKNLDDFLQQHQLQTENQATLKSIDKELKSEYSPKLFNLSDLQKFANKRFKLTAQQTLTTVQSLYEKHKLLSYPRSDCHFVTENEFTYLTAHLNDYLNILSKRIENPLKTPNKRYVDNKKVQAHYAIVPTDKIPSEEALQQLTSAERNIYLEVLKRTVAMYEEPYQYEQTIFTFDIQQVDFKAKGKVVKNLGYRRILQDTKADTKKEDTLPDLKENSVYASTLLTETKQTKPLPRYTEGTIIEAMENAGRTIEDKENKQILKETQGIGTEATRANIIETLKKEKYIVSEKNILYCTSKGTTLCQLLTGLPIASADFTAEWEKVLKQIGQGNAKQEQFIQATQRYILDLIQQLEKRFGMEKVGRFLQGLQQEQIKQDEAKVLAKCPLCDGQLTDKGKFYGCSNYPNCKITLSKDFRGKKLTKQNFTDLLSGKTTLIKGIKKKDKKNTYNAIIALDNHYKIQFKEFSK